MKTADRKDFAPWLLLPGVVLALSSVTLLAPHQAALASPPPQATPQAPAGDGDGDELLEHWGDPQFAQEERTQMAGMAAGFLALGAAAGLRRSRRLRRRETVLLPTGSDILPLDDFSDLDTRKAA